MAIPPHHPSEQIRQIEQALGDDIVSHIENLRPEDLQLIGSLVQMYNFIEYNLRRSVAIFGHAGLIPIPKSPVRMAELIGKTKSAVEKMSPKNEDIAETVARLDEIELRREFRNLLAHWAAKRVKEEDAFILFSQDSKDLQRVTGEGLANDFSGYCIVSVVHIRGLVEHLTSYERWIAEKVNVWHRQYPALS